MFCSETAGIQVLLAPLGWTITSLMLSSIGKIAVVC